MADDAYYVALGHFVENYAATEQIIHLCFPALTKIERDRANIIKNEMPPGNLAAIIKALLALDRSPMLAEVTDLLTQFSVISTFRHTVIHRGTHPGYAAQGKFVATNIATFKTPDSYEETEYSIPQLFAAVLDLWFIGKRLLAAANPETCPLRRYELDGHDALAPWRYRRIAPRTPWKAEPPKEKKARPPRRKPSRK